MTLYLSRPFEDLEVQSQRSIQTHTLIVGSGYGAALSAIALAMRDDYKDGRNKIMVIERGNEFVPGDFPKTMSDLPAHVSVRPNNAARMGDAGSLFDVRLGENVMAIVANGLGGTSLINAGVAVDPDDSTLAGLPPYLGAGNAAWSAQLAGSVRFVRHLLGVGPHPSGNALSKVVALKRIAESLAKSGDHTSHGAVHHSLADIAVTFQDGENAVGVVQSKCNDCGNCFSGCNTGAKNTLAMNAWPLARSLGVELFTGGSVDFIQTNNGASAPEYPWEVNAHRTTDASAAKPVQIQARCVILAAGTFGSTEILKRSSQRGLSLSNKCLGTRFSLNGDDIGFGFGQRAAVNAAAKVPSARYVHPQATEQPGPTIVSLIDLKHAGSRGLLQDATVPQAIARLWAEALSTQALVRGFAENNPSAWHRDNAQADPLVVSASLTDHHQVVLGMHNDSVTGTLEYADPQASLDSAGLNLVWPGGGGKQETTPASWIDQQLTLAESRQGFDGGLYLANPFLTPLPEKLTKGIAGAPQFGGTYLCNHPLGGCPMGADAAQGVVNSRGQVFSGSSGDAVHAGLYVLDGAIIPGALGINPYMTIASLAHHLAQRIDVPTAADLLPPRISDAPVAIPSKPGQVIDWPIPPLVFDFKERLFTTALKQDTETVMALLGLPPNDHDKNSLVVDATVTFADVYRWIEQPSEALPARFHVYCNTRGDHTIDTVRDKDLGAPIGVSVNGSVQLFAPDAKAPSTLKLIWRSLLALRRFYALRKNEIFDSIKGSLTGASSVGMFEIFCRAACQSGHWRYFNYKFETEINGRQLSVHGRKTLAYDGSKDRTIRDAANPWTTLANMEIYFENPNTRQRASAWFRVDLVRMAKNIKPLQIASYAETPQGILGVSSLAALAARVLLQTHFFSLGAPSYESFPTREFIESRYALHKPPSSITYVQAGIKEEYRVEQISRPPDQKWRLLRALPKGARAAAKANPILLIHGLAHSSRVFYTDTVDRNLAGHLLHEGFEVWLLDHGLSTSLIQAPGYKPNIDEIAVQVAAAIRQIYDRTAMKVVIFSHCVGSAALSMSILSGRNTLPHPDSDNNPGSLIERLVMHAIPPWIYPSQTNLLRAYVGVFFKDKFFPQSIDPIPVYSQQPSAMNSLLDRIAFSFPWTKTEYDDHSFRDKDREYGRAICNRMTAFYGYEWSHANLDERTHKQIVSLVGAADPNAYRQLYFLLNRKRVTNALGENIYLTQDNIAKYWTFPTMFIHGRNNQVFNVESSVLSAHQLKHLQKQQSVPPGHDRTVKLAVIEGYGHMDLLFGKRAYDDVFCWITDFFGDNIKPPSVERPKSETRAPQHPMTGPVISNPMRREDKHWVRVWVETDEFQTSQAIGVEYDTPGSPRPPLEASSGSGDPSLNCGAERLTHTNLLKNSRYWLSEVECDQHSVFVPRVINQEPGAQLVAPPVVSGSLNAGTAEKIGTHANAMDWRGLSWFQRFLSGATPDSVSFVVGSCWYPGTWIDHHGSDRLFTKIRAEITKSDGIDSLLLVGDQIYADAYYGIFDIAENRERFQQSYRRAFKSDKAAWVLRQVPTYFAIGDHEFRERYPDAIAGDAPDTLIGLGNEGAQEAWNYQMHHHNPPPAPSNPRIPHLDNRLWYSFESAGFRFFVFDTRSERHARPQGAPQLISDAQRTGFKQWVGALEQYPDGKPIFLVTGSPLVPVPADELRHPARASSSDSLRAYPEFLALVAQALTSASVNHPIVWLSGSPHYSSMGRFVIRDAQDRPLLNCLGIVSSGINSPLPFANGRPDAIDWDVKDAEFRPSGPGINVLIRDVRMLCGSRQNAIRVDVKQSAAQTWSLQVTVIDAYNSHSGTPSAPLPLPLPLPPLPL